ncbi:MAG TPA: YwiC-like family protein [bacterium]
MSPTGPTPPRAELPHQHGAWSILAAAFLLGLGAAPGPVPGRVWALLAAILAGFIGRELLSRHLRQAARTGPAAARRLTLLAVCGAVILLACSWLMLRHRLIWLAAFGAIEAACVLILGGFERRRRHLSLEAELVGTAGLSLVTLITAYAKTGALSADAVGLWATSALFFCASVFHVRYIVRRRIERAGPLSARLRAGAVSVLYHAVAAGVIAGMGLAGLLPPLAGVAWVPVLGKALLTALRRDTGRLVMRRIGLTELAHTTLFVLLTIVAWRAA